MSKDKLKIKSMVSGQSVRFDAYLTDMAQSFSSTWNSEEVFGRNDPIATFQGTKRTLSLSFEVPAANEKEAKINLRNCGKLSSFLYPGINQVIGRKEDGSGLDEGGSVALESVTTFQSKAPLVKIKFANIIRSMNNASEGLLGWIDSYSFAPNMEAGMFTSGRAYYPRVITVTISFTALHQVELGFGRSEKLRKKGGKVETVLGKIKWAAGKLPFE